MKQPKRGRRWLLLVVLAVVLAVVWFWLSHRGSQHAATASRVTSSSALAKYLEASKAASAKERAIVERAVAAKSDKERISILAAAPRLLKALALANASLHSIDIRCRVIDQFERPVTAVRVVFLAGGGLGGADPTYGFATSDANGYFEMKAKGDDLNIVEMTRAGYQFNWSVQARRFCSVKRPGCPDFDELDPTHPIIYRGWKVPDDMRPTKMEKERLSAILFRGRPNAFDFFRPGNDKVIETGEGGQLVAEFVPEAGAVETERGLLSKDWIVKVSVRGGGGLVPAEGVFMNEPPASGYQTAVEMRVRDKPPWNSRSYDWHWYIYLPEHKRYGRVSFEIGRPDELSKGVIVMTSFCFNPTGQRYLDAFGGSL